MIKKLIIFFLLCAFPQLTQAEHLVGGVISYRHISGNTYEVTLKVYRDCFSSGAPFDSPDTFNGSAVIGIFTGENQLYNTFLMGYPTISEIDPSLSGLCDDIDVPACVEEGVYVNTVELPPSSIGYKLVYQRCCRNSTILNILSPGDTGSTYTAFVPPTAVVEGNSCPTFDNFPPVGLCLNKDLEFDHGATDIDGDSLVYSFCNPFSGASTADPQPGIPSSPEYQEVVWEAGYSTEYQIASNPAFAVDSETGMLTGTPNQQGQFVIGICVQEYRDGVFLSEVRRDFQFNVVICPEQPIAEFDESSSSVDCNNLVEFENNSTLGDQYFWDFGDGNFSTEFSPTHVYAGGGSFDVELTVTSGNCFDSQMIEITLLGQPDPQFEDPIFECVGGQELYSIDVSNVGTEGYSYEWNIEGQPTINSSSPNLSNIEFDTEGTYSVVVTAEDPNGCAGSDETIIIVNPPAIASFEVDDGVCSGFDRNFESSSLNASNIYWEFGFDYPGDATNLNNVPVSFPAIGDYYVYLVASGELVCNDTTFQTVTVSELPYADVAMPEPQCQEGNSSDFIITGNYATPASYSWSIEDAEPFSSTASSINNLSVTTAGTHAVELIVNDADGCELIVEDSFETIAPLQVGFTTQGTGCLPYQAYFNNTTTGGSSVLYLWDFGNGNGSVENSPIELYEETGSYDVTLTAESTNGCIESYTITIPNALSTYPSPPSGFDVNPKEVTIIDPEIQITSLVDSVSCEYFISDESYYDNCEFSHVFNDAGTFEITQIVTNEYDCSVNLTRVVDVTGHLFYAPNAITMNDDGVNDFWRPHIVGDIVDYELLIYNRDGQVIFETQDHKQAWRPEYSHDGQYNFIATVRDKNSTPVVYKGSFITFR